MTIFSYEIEQVNESEQYLTARHNMEETCLIVGEVNDKNKSYKIYFTGVNEINNLIEQLNELKQKVEKK